MDGYIKSLEKRFGKDRIPDLRELTVWQIDSQKCTVQSVSLALSLSTVLW